MYFEIISIFKMHSKINTKIAFIREFLPEHHFQSNLTGSRICSLIFTAVDWDPSSQDSSGGCSKGS